MPRNRKPWVRNGKRGGNVARLNDECRVMRPIVDESGTRYDGSHGFRNAQGEWQTFVLAGRVKNGKAGQVLADGSKVNRTTGSTWEHENEVAKTIQDHENKLPQFRGV